MLVQIDKCIKLCNFMCMHIVVVIVSFTESEYNASEGAGFMRIGVQLSRVLQQMITIQVAATGITAQGLYFLRYCLVVNNFYIISRKWSRF